MQRASHVYKANGNVTDNGNRPKISKQRQNQYESSITK